MIFQKAKIEIVNIPEKIGDALVFSALPENFFRSHGEKLIYKGTNWVFDENPYLDRLSNSDFKLDPGKVVDEFDKANTKKFFSITERVAAAFNAKCWQRAPRLYFLNNLPSEPNDIVLHFQAISEFEPFPEYIVDHIVKKYRNRSLIQIGAKTDIRFSNYPAIYDFRGASITKSVELIASASIFIGVMSGPMHIANCFDHVRKKAVILRDNESRIFSDGLFGEWIDYNWEYYNKFDHDLGVTRSYLKI